MKYIARRFPSAQEESRAYRQPATTSFLAHFLLILRRDHRILRKMPLVYFDWTYSSTSVL